MYNLQSLVKLAYQNAYNAETSSLKVAMSHQDSKGRNGVSTTQKLIIGGGGLVGLTSLGIVGARGVRAARNTGSFLRRMVSYAKAVS